MKCLKVMANFMIQMEAHISAETQISLFSDSNSTDTRYKIKILAHQVICQMKTRHNQVIGLIPGSTEFVKEQKNTLWPDSGLGFF